MVRIVYHEPRHANPLWERFCHSRITRALLSLIAVFFTACGTSSQQDAIQRTTEGLIRSIEINDLQEMAKYVVREDGSPCAPEELKELLARERPWLLARLARANAERTRVQVRHEYFLSNVHKVTVINEINGNHVRDVIRIDACPTSIEGALRLLSEHIKLRYHVGGLDDSPLRFLTLSAQEQWVSDVKIWTDSLALPEELDVEESGTKASVHLPTGQIVELRNEFDCWRIERFR
jgi:hypothetical protein